MNAIELGIFASRLNAVCDEMGAVLQRTAFSPNIRDRQDYSCAIFDANGELCAQAAHIPVHLGSMAYAMRDIVAGIAWQEGDMVIVNDPYLGGTHLPDVTLVAPVFYQNELQAFVANRAHHADIGAETPGSMPLSRHLDEEGVVIPPTRLMVQNAISEAVMTRIISAIHSGATGRGDFAAQISANRSGLLRLGVLVSDMGRASFQKALVALNDYAERLARSTLDAIPDGVYRFTDVMDDDGMGHTDIPIQVTLQVERHQVRVDFTGTAWTDAGLRWQLPANHSLCTRRLPSERPPPGCGGGWQRGDQYPRRGRGDGGAGTGASRTDACCQPGQHE
jgi:N-methylhydantoinase B